ncbi:MAG: M14 family zinc carboxypeptidase [bacterium]
MQILKPLLCMLLTLNLTGCMFIGESTPSDETEHGSGSTPIVEESDSGLVDIEEEMALDADLSEAAVSEADIASASPAEIESAKTDPVTESVVVNEGDLDADLPAPAEITLDIESLAVEDPTINLCEEIGNKLDSVSVEECLDQNLVHSALTAAKRSLAFKDYAPIPEREPLGRVLVIGGIHGDEFSSVSVIIKWMGILDEFHSGLFHWRFVPTANPDGLLNQKSQRQNLNGVDLNRNFPTADWEGHARSYWEEHANRNPRRDPGPAQASEPETQWLVKQIEEFDPDVIISMHAPYHLVDYDGPPSAPDVLGTLHLHKLGVYPGSLGNYAGIDKQTPIVTVELASAGIMPAKREIDSMWRDLVRWLRGQLSG